jgi:hypothetical protein
MKKFATWGTIVVLIAFSLAACGKKTGAPVAGQAEAGAMLNLIPMDVQGVFVFDAHKALNTEFADKAIKSDKNYAKYQEFVKETGLDPQKDIYFLAVGIANKAGAKEPDAVVVANLKYNKDLLLAKMKKEAKSEIKEEPYNGVTLYLASKPETGKNGAGAFLDASNVAMGTEDMVKQVIDIYQKKADNVWKNETLAAVIKTSNTNAMVWSAFAIPPEAMQKMAQQNPMMSSLEGMKAVTMFFDFKDKALSLEIKLAGGEAAKNKQLADMMTGFKALGAGAAAKNPDVGDLLNRIEISAGADFVKINAAIPEDLLQKLTKSAAQKVEGMMAPKAAEPKEEPAEEKKD